MDKGNVKSIISNMKKKMEREENNQSYLNKASILAVIIAVLVFGYSVYSMVVNDFYLPGRYGYDIHIHGYPIIFSIISSLLILILTLIPFHPKWKGLSDNFKKSILGILMIIIIVMFGIMLCSYFYKNGFPE
jgi:drug/metabolite transporter (DMT)-like permease